MILSIGEILADMIGGNSSGNLSFNAFCGGAPFNVAVNAKRAGAKVVFLGKVGDDPIGKFLIEQAKKANFDGLEIQVDPVKNTTLAFVTLTDGERDFAFYRHDTADYQIDLEECKSFNDKDLSIVHLGSLMLSEKVGVDLAKSVVNKAKKLGKKISFDVNFRLDLYNDFDDAINAYKPFVEQADIIKFSDDELLAYTGESDLMKAIEKVSKKDVLLVVTMGSKGSLYYYNENMKIIPTDVVKPIDTTGAGDAFFGTLLACLDGKDFNEENLTIAMQKANQTGAKTTQFLGAVEL